MANEKNLVRPSSNEARENGRKGGVASGKSRKAKKTFGEIMSVLLEMPVTDESELALLERLGFEKDDMRHDVVLMVGLLNRAKQGDAKAFEIIQSMTAHHMSMEELKAYMDMQTKKVKW